MLNMSWQRSLFGSGFRLLIRLTGLQISPTADDSNKNLGNYIMLMHSKHIKSRVKIIVHDKTNRFVAPCKEYLEINRQFHSLVEI